MKTRTVEITDQDVDFVRLALDHYRLFAKASEKQGQDRSAGVLRRQEFYAERFLARLEAE